MVSTIKGSSVDFKPEALRENLKKVSEKVEPEKLSSDRLSISGVKPGAQSTSLILELSNLVSANNLNDAEAIKEKLSAISEQFGAEVARELEQGLDNIIQNGSRGVIEFRNKLEQLVIAEENKQAASVNFQDLDSATNTLEQLKEQISQNAEQALSAFIKPDPGHIE